MKSLDARVRKLEQQQRQHLYGAIAQELGLTVEQLLQEAEDFLAQPLANQLAEVDRIAANMERAGEPWGDVENVKHALRTYYQP